MHDVAIAGGSIAGASVAAALARAGLSVVILERAPVPRRKACGEGILPRGTAALRELGLLESLLERGADLHTLRFEAGRHRAEASFPGPALGIRRSILDAALLGYARDRGADVRRGVMVRGLRIENRRVSAFDTSAGDVPARAFVAADGLHSRLRRAAHLESPRQGSRYGLSAHARVPGLEPSAVRVIFRPEGELYVTPVGNGAANLALLVRKPQMRRFAGDPAPGFRAAVDAFGLSGAELVDAPAVSGPFQRSSTRPWRANLVLAGDAAGFFDGITGEGMSAALAAAPACAAAVTRYLETGSYDGFRVYARELRALSRSANRLGRVTLALGRRQRLASFAIANLEREPATFARLLAISSGEASFTSLRPRDLLALATGR